MVARAHRPDVAPVRLAVTEPPSIASMTPSALRGCTVRSFIAVERDRGQPGCARAHPSPAIVPSRVTTATGAPGAIASPLIAASAWGRFVAAPGGRPECTPTAAKISRIRGGNDRRHGTPPADRPADEDALRIDAMRVHDCLRHGGDQARLASTAALMAVLETSSNSGMGWHPGTAPGRARRIRPRARASFIACAGREIIGVLRASRAT
jgi:hypothetical protein